MQNSVSVLHPQHRDSRYRASAALFHAKARVSPEKTAGNLTYEQAAKPIRTGTKPAHQAKRRICGKGASFQKRHAIPLIKYSNGGCSGFEPDFLFIYSVHNFSNRIFSYPYSIVRLLHRHFTMFSPACQPITYDKLIFSAAMK